MKTESVYVENNMAYWFNLRDTQIVGTGRGKAVPIGATGVDETTFTQYQALKKKAVSEGRTPVITYENDTLALAPDNRIILKFDISTNDTVDGKDVIEADGVDAATITISVMQTDEVTVRKNVNATRLLPLFGGRLFKVTVVKGVGTVSFTTTETGVYSVQSNDEYKLVGETSFIAADY